MSRNVPAALLTALSQPEVQPYYAVELNFDTAPFRIWTGYGDKTLFTNTYTGTGNLLSIGGLEEASDLSARSTTLTLSGVPQSLVSIGLQEPYQNRSCKVYFGTQDTATPIEVFSGIMNTMRFEDSGETSTIILTVESKLVRLEKSSNWRYTEQSQKSRHPIDKFFDYVADLQDKELLWGREKS
jgi:hypothetical protein